jgi:hypothetical protein
MGKLIDLTDKLKQLTPDRVEKEVLIIVKANEEVATNLNTDQLFGGKDSKGVNLPKYSLRSVQIFRKPAGPMRLFDEGDFYRGFFLKADKFPIIFQSSDRKTGKIADMLASRGHNPDDIYGLQKSNLTEFSKVYVLEDLQKFLREFIRV